MGVEIGVRCRMRGRLLRRRSGKPGELSTRYVFGNSDTHSFEKETCGIFFLAFGAHHSHGSPKMPGDYAGCPPLYQLHSQ